MATLNCSELDQFDNSGFEALPDAEYVVMVRSSTVKAPKSDPTAEMITLECDVIDGKAKGRKLFFRFNTKNKSKQAQDIGRAQFKQLREAIGRPNPKDTLELHNVPFRVHLACRKGRDGDMENFPKKYMPAAKGPSPAAQAVAQATSAPWKRDVPGEPVQLPAEPAPHGQPVPF